MRTHLEEQWVDWGEARWWVLAVSSRKAGCKIASFYWREAICVKKHRKLAVTKVHVLKVVSLRIYTELSVTSEFESPSFSFKNLLVCADRAVCGVGILRAEHRALQDWPWPRIVGLSRSCWWAGGPTCQTVLAISSFLSANHVEEGSYTEYFINCCNHC